MLSAAGCGHSPDQKAFSAQQRTAPPVEAIIVEPHSTPVITDDDSWPDMAEKYKLAWSTEVCARELSKINYQRYAARLGGAVEKRSLFGRKPMQKDPCAELRRLTQEAPKDR